MSICKTIECLKEYCTYNYSGIHMISDKKNKVALSCTYPNVPPRKYNYGPSTIFGKIFNADVNRYFLEHM